MKPKIAILGAGLAGLAVGYKLSQQAEITLFDPNGIGGGASGIAAGLLHPFVGQTGKLSTFGREGMKATLSLLEEIGEPFLKGLIRLPFRKQMEEGFLLHPEFIPLTPEETKKKFPAIGAKNSFWSEEGYVVNTPSYLQSLFKGIKDAGGSLIPERINDFSALKAFDKILLAMGHETPLVDIHPIKGRIIEVEWPASLPRLPCPVSGEGYIIPKENSCLIGATYERGPETVDREKELLLKGENMVEGLSKAPILKILHGTRASTKDRLPLVKQLEERLFVFTGLGSRGLLYHALFADKVLSLLGF